jgi:hypothetical protein
MLWGSIQTHFKSKKFSFYFDKYFIVSLFFIIQGSRAGIKILNKWSKIK